MEVNKESAAEKFQIFKTLRTDDFEMANFVFYRLSAEAETDNAHLIVEAE